MKLLSRKNLAIFTLIIGFILLAGYLLPEILVIPVKGASKSDWNHNTFWHPWGKSGVHRGIDIFAKEGLPLLLHAPALLSTPVIFLRAATLYPSSVPGGESTITLI